MKLSCEKTPLQAIISTISGVVSPKSPTPAPEGILLEASSDLRLTDYNLETGIRTIAPADIRGEGTLVLGARLFGGIARKLPDDIVTPQSENYMVDIKCGMSEFNIPGTDPEEFPELSTAEYQNSLVLPQSRLKVMISRALFAISDNENRPIHTGSLLEVDSKGLTIVSMGDYRLAPRHESIDKKEGTETFSFVVPDAALSEVEKIYSDVNKSTSVAQGARHVTFRVKDAMLAPRQLEGEFLAYRQAVPHDDTIHVEGDTHALPSSINRASLITSDKLESPLRCVFDSNLLKISTKIAIDDTYDECPLSGDGGGLGIGLNNKYLMGALRAAPVGRARPEPTTGVPPCVTLPTGGGENFLYMVLPMRLEAGG